MTRIMGELVIVDFDAGADHQELALESEGECYLVAAGAFQEDLEHCVGRDVELEGSIERNERGEAVFRVQGYGVLELMAEEDQDEFGDDEEFPDADW